MKNLSELFDFPEEFTFTTNQKCLSAKAQPVVLEI